MKWQKKNVICINLLSYPYDIKKIKNKNKKINSSLKNLLFKIQNSNSKKKKKNPIFGHVLREERLDGQSTYSPPIFFPVWGDMILVDSRRKHLDSTVKLWFTTMCFIGFNSVPNLIVILFNLLYHVFIVGFGCKGCVIKRKCEYSSNWRLKSFRGYLATSHPTKWLMWLAHAGMWRVRTGWRQLYLTSISRVRSSRETLVRHSILPDCQFWNTFCAYSTYTHITHKC